MRRANAIAIGAFAVLAIAASGISGCASCSRTMKTIDSDLSGGIPRNVRVYDYQGDLVQEYEGTIDTEYSEGRYLFDMDGKRYTVSGGIVIIEEK